MRRPLKMHQAIFLLFAVGLVTCQKKEGDTCTDEFSGTSGHCSQLNKCQSAQKDFKLNGRPLTFCINSVNSNTLICCKDGNADPQAADSDRPVWGTTGTGKPRVCEKKCKDYGRSVQEVSNYGSLLVNPQKVTVTAQKCNYTDVGLIVGGEKTRQGEFPHMAAIGWSNPGGDYSFGCGGSLISPRFVLTAGHCLQRRSQVNPEPVVVRLGDQNINPKVNDGAHPIDVNIKKVHKHPSYKPPSSYDDIALLELDSDVNFSAEIRPACLWTREDYAPYDRAIATGWGVTDTSLYSTKTSDELKKVSLSILETSQCDRLLKPIRNHNWQGFRDTQMCAGELSGGEDTCQGDSGSPLQVASRENRCIFHVIGVTSFGRRCAEIGRPAVYTRVFAYLNWIEGVVWPGE